MSEQRPRGNDALKVDGDPFTMFTHIKNEKPKKGINRRIDDAKQDVLNITDRMPYPG
jgi:hypothetical protein